MAHTTPVGNVRAVVRPRMGDDRPSFVAGVVVLAAMKPAAMQQWQRAAVAELRWSSGGRRGDADLAIGTGSNGSW
ncbi:hypothetical protein SESBI_07794 [Sesbania bispinosa]|nr:hypothetical protein SESBI_07794 [Sesbania bispinosa]